MHRLFQSAVTRVATTDGLVSAICPTGNCDIRGFCVGAGGLERGESPDIPV